MRILAATDGSRAGNAAVRFAARLANGNHQNIITIVTVHEAEDDGGAAGAEKVLARAARQLRGQPAVYRRVRARVGAVPEAIARTADRIRADLVVIGSEGRDSLQEWVVGGTALRLIYVARRPVTVVRAPRRRTSGGLAARVLR